MKLRRWIAMKKPAVLATALLLALGCMPTAASADPPTRRLLPSPNNIVSLHCGVPIEVTYVVWSFTSTTFSTEQSPLAEIWSGNGKVQLTNLETGEAVELNISGPLTVFQYADGSSVRALEGPWLFVGIAPGQGVPPVFLTEGRVTFTRDAEGHISIAGTGRVVDLCAELAA